MKNRLLVFNSGGGSGFQELVENTKTGVLDAKVVGLVTNTPQEKCVQRAEMLGIHWTGMDRFSEGHYQAVILRYRPDFIALSGWLVKARGMDPRTTINIHPGPLPIFGGKGMHGHHVHDAVIKAYKAGTIQNSAVTMHFVTAEYDKGPIFFEYPVSIRPDDTAETLGARVNKIEHGWQSYVTNLVLNYEIYWDGENPDSLVVPDHMKQFLPKHINAKKNNV